MVLAIWNYKVKELKVHLKMLNYKTFKFQAFVLVNVLFLKPNYFKKQHSLSSFLFTYSNNRGPNWPQVLSRLVPCIQDMELACWILHWHFGVVFLPYLSKNDDEEFCVLKKFLRYFSSSLWDLFRCVFNFALMKKAFWQKLHSEGLNLWDFLRCAFNFGPWWKKTLHINYIHKA